MTDHPTMQAAYSKRTAAVPHRDGRPPGAGQRPGPGSHRGERREPARYENPRRRSGAREASAAGDSRHRPRRHRRGGRPGRDALPARRRGVRHDRRRRRPSGVARPIRRRRRRLAGAQAGQSHACARRAALPLVFITAWEGLVDRMAVAAGQTVLVQGGAGGVGQMAIQIAEARGAEVFATGSPSQRGDDRAPRRQLHRPRPSRSRNLSRA